MRSISVKKIRNTLSSLQKRKKKCIFFCSWEKRKGEKSVRKETEKWKKVRSGLGFFYKCKSWEWALGSEFTEFQ